MLILFGTPVYINSIKNFTRQVPNYDTYSTKHYKDDHTTWNNRLCQLLGNKHRNKDN